MRGRIDEAQCFGFGARCSDGFPIGGQHRSSESAGFVHRGRSADWCGSDDRGSSAGRYLVDTTLDWWEYTTLDADRNGIHDSLQTAVGPVNVGLSYAREVTQTNRDDLARLGFDIHQELPIVDALLLGDVDASQVWLLAELDGVVMVERYGSSTATSRHPPSRRATRPNIRSALGIWASQARVSTSP